MKLCAKCETPFQSEYPTKKYCSKRCQQRARELRKYHKRENARRNRGRYWHAGGYVYLVQEGAGGPIKLGWAKNPETRLEYHQCGNPRELILLGSFPGGIADERALHARFSEHRIRGEWFHPVPELLALLK